MTAQQKALKLCQQFGVIGMDFSQTDFYSFDKEIAKRCAAVCVSEILSAYENGGACSTKDLEYWSAVKNEIEKV